MPTARYVRFASRNMPHGVRGNTLATLREIQHLSTVEIRFAKYNGNTSHSAR